MEKFKEHYNENGHIYWLIAAIPFFLWIFNLLLSTLSKFNNILSEIIYSNFYKNFDFLFVLSFLMPVVLFLMIFLKIESFIKDTNLILKIVIILSIIFSIFNAGIALTKVDLRNEIYEKKEILDPFINTETKKEINKKIYKISNYKEYSDVQKYLNILIEQEIK